MRHLAVGLALAVSGCSFLVDFAALEGESEQASDASTPELDAAMDAPGPPAPARDAASDAPAVVSDASDAATELPYRAAVLADTPVAYWPFDETAGALVAHDRMGTYDAEAEGVVTFGAPGISGTAVRIDDAASRLGLGDTFDLLGDFAIEYWALPKLEDTYNNVLWHRDGSDLGWVSYFGSDGHIQFEQNWDAGGRVGFSEGAHTYTKLTQIVISFEAAKGLSMYLDGVKLTKVFLSGTGAPVAFAADAFIALSYTGTIDELAIYDHGLAPDRIAAHRAAAGQ